MTVSQTLVKQIVDTMKHTDKPYTVSELTKVFNLSPSTVRQALSTAIATNEVVKRPTYPVTWKATKAQANTADTVLVIREPVRPVEISDDKVRQIRKAIDNADYPVGTSRKIFEAYMEIKPEKRPIFRDFLINFAEYIRQDLENNGELKPEDIKVKV